MIYIAFTSITKWRTVNNIENRTEQNKKTQLNYANYTNMFMMFASNKGCIFLKSRGHDAWQKITNLRTSFKSLQSRYWIV